MTADTTYFTGLVTDEHKDKPRYLQTVSFTTQGFADQIALCSQSYDLYDLDNAVGLQLDAVGIWVGLSRFVALDVGQYFSWDTHGVGWDQGVWWEVGDAESMVTTLQDAQYRTLLKVKIACNHFDGTLPSALAILNNAVAIDGCTVTAAEGDMSVTFNVSGDISTVMRAVIEKNYIALKPAGITVNYTFSGS